MNRTRFSPSFLVAALALAVALGGGVGYAAGQLPKNSVGSKQLKKNAVTAKKLKSGSVTGDKVADQSLTGVDLATGSVTGAQVDESTLVLPKASGTVRIAGTQFLPESSTTAFNVIGQSGIFSSTVDGAFRAQVPLPAGASVTGVRVRVLDVGVDGATAVVRRVDMFDQANAVDGPETGTVGTPGSVTLTPVVPAAVSSTDLVLVRVVLGSGSQTALYGAEIDYQ
jgi:hypothetical protein